MPRAAYSKVITAFAQEQKLVAEAYIRLADMYTQGGDDQAAVRTYREAIDGSRNRIFQASMQSLLAEHYYGIGNYQRAIAEYQLYLDAYGDVAKAAGLAPHLGPFTRSGGPITSRLNSSAKPRTTRPAWPTHRRSPLMNALPPTIPAAN